MRVAYVGQRDGDSCGVAVATMALRLLGREARYRDVEGLLLPDPFEGVANPALGAFFREGGLDARMFAARDVSGSSGIVDGNPLEALERLSEGGVAIVNYRLKGVGHYAIVEGMNGNVVLHDPTLGPGKHVSREWFAERWKSGWYPTPEDPAECAFLVVRG